MKVLLATHFFPPGHPGGTEAYTLGLARMLDRLGHSPAVICAEDWGVGDSWRPRHKDTVFAGLPVRRLYWNWQLAPDPFVDMYNNSEVEGHFSRYLRELRPDIVHVTSCYALGAGVIRASHEMGIPTFLTLTDFWFICPRHTLQRGDGSLCLGPETAAKCAHCMASASVVFRTMAALLTSRVVARGLLAVSRWPKVARLDGFRGYVGDVTKRLVFLRRVFDDIDVAIAPSRFLIEMFGRNGYPSERILLSRYGLDTSWLPQLRTRHPGVRPCIGYIGQIDPIKGVDLLIRGFQTVADQVSAELRIYGDLTKNPGFSAGLRRMADRNPDIRFMGPFERSQIASVFSDLDILVVPSVWYENAPVVIAEAFAARKPVITTDLSGMTELVEHGVNGLVFQRGDVSGLASQIRLLVEDAALRERLRQGIKPVRTIEDEVESLLRLYSTAAKRALSRLPRSPSRSHQE